MNHRCNGKLACDLRATQASLGLSNDPCQNIVKKLRVEYTCKGFEVSTPYIIGREGGSCDDACQIINLSCDENGVKR